MAPVNADHQLLLDSINHILADVFQVMAQTQNYDSGGRPSREALAQDLQSLDTTLLAMHRTAAETLATGPGIPEPLFRYVENGRNPDIYTREFVELVRRMNQVTRGKTRAFAAFRDVLAHEMDTAMPELRDDVRRVVAATGGPGPAPPALLMATTGGPTSDTNAGPSAGAAGASGGGGGAGVGTASGQ